MSLNPSTPLSVTLSYASKTVHATLPLTVQQQDGYYVMAPAELMLSVPDHLDYSSMKLHDPVIRQRIGDAVVQALDTVAADEQTPTREAVVSGLPNAVNIAFSDLPVDWRNPQQYRYTHYEVVGPSSMNEAMPALSFADKASAYAVCQAMQGMEVVEMRDKLFSEHVQQSINQAPVTTILFRALAEQARERHGIVSDNMNDVWLFMKEAIEEKPEVRQLRSLFPALTPLTDATIDEAANVMLANSQLSSVDTMLITPVAARHMLDTLKHSDTPISQPFSHLPQVAASDTLSLEFSAAAQSGQGWVEGVAVLRQDGSLLGMVSPDEKAASLIFSPDPTYRSHAANLIVTGPEQVSHVMGYNDPTRSEQAPGRAR